MGMGVGGRGQNSFTKQHFTKKMGEGLIIYQSKPIFNEKYESLYHKVKGWDQITRELVT